LRFVLMVVMSGMIAHSGFRLGAQSRPITRDLSGQEPSAIAPDWSSLSVRHRLRSEDILANSVVDSVAVSPNGLVAAVVIIRGKNLSHEHFGWDHLPDGARADIWLLRRDGVAAEQITHGDKDGSGYWKPQWSKNSRFLAMLSTRGGDNVHIDFWDDRLRKLDRVTNAAPQLDAVMDAEGAPFRWLSDASILIAVMPKNGHPIQFEMGTSARRTMINKLWPVTERGTAAVVDTVEGGVEIPESLRAQGSVELISVLNHRASSLGAANVRIVTVDPTGKYAAVIAEASNALPRPDQLLNEDWEFDGFHYHNYMHRKVGVLALTPNGSIHWVGGVYDPRLGRSHDTWRSKENCFAIIGKTELASNSPETQLCISSTGGVSRLDVGASLERRVALPEVSEAGGSQGLTRIGYSGATGLSVFTSMPDHGTLIWTSSLIHPEPVVRLCLNRHLANVVNDMEKPIVIKYRASDGKTYNGHVFLPANYDPGRRYPTILWVYPGQVLLEEVAASDRGVPHANDFIDPRLLAAHGYVCVHASIPRSAGDPILSLPGFVLPLLDAVVDAKIADPARVGLIGHSHGGLAALGLLTLTDRFKAAVTIAAPTDILHEYGDFYQSYGNVAFPNENTTGILAYEKTDSTLSIESTPWSDPVRWFRNNPVYHLDRVTTPVMLIHADNDVFSTTNAEVVLSGLHRLGKRVRYVRYYGENHSLQSPANICDMWARVYEWFDQNFADALQVVGPNHMPAAKGRERAGGF
jgi:acetyl esterase/lipase